MSFSHYCLVKFILYLLDNRSRLKIVVFSTLLNWLDQGLRFLFFNHSFINGYWILACYHHRIKLLSLSFDTFSIRIKVRFFPIAHQILSVLLFVIFLRFHMLLHNIAKKYWLYVIHSLDTLKFKLMGIWSFFWY